MADWENVRFFLELYRCGSLSQAARRLRVDHTTVARRIAGLEASLGVRLFDRSARGYDRTRAADDLLPLAERVEEGVHAIERRAQSADIDYVGVVRVTTTDHLIATFLAPALPRLATRYPELVVEAVADNREVSLSRREADIALRLGRPRDGGVVSRKVGEVAYGFYGSAGARRGAVDFAADRFVGYDDTLAHVPQERWLAKVAPDRRVAFRTNTLHALQGAARAGLGLALLPCFVGDADGDLARIACVDLPPLRELFLLVHADLRASPRVRAVLDFLIAEVEACRAAFAGTLASRRPRRREPRS